MLRRTMYRMLLIALMMTGATAVPLSAQGLLDMANRDGDEFTRSMMTELTSILTDYWTPRLNNYRNYIDSRISTGDRTQLNNLRIRWAIQMEQFQRMRQEEMQRMEAQMDSRDFGTEWEVAAEQPASKKECTAAQREACAASKKECAAKKEACTASKKECAAKKEACAASKKECTARMELTVAPVETEGGDGHDAPQTTALVNEISIEEVDGPEVATEEEFVSYDQLPEDRAFENPEAQQFRKEKKAMRSEVETILEQSEEIVTRNQNALNGLRPILKEDMTEFFNVLVKRMTAFLEENSDKAGKNEMAMAMMMMLQSPEIQPMIDEVTTELVSEVDENFNDALSFIQLFNGDSDFLRQMLMGEGNAVSGPAGVASELGPIDAQVLMQNTPNPAGSTTSVPYNLKEASSKTVLRLYDAQGNVVRTEDLGSRPAGEHSVTLNVRDLPNGSYLYHLTTETAEGTQVFSKIMQVTK